MRLPTDVVKGVRQTEKSTRLAAHGQYVVNVAVNANKAEIRESVERLFHVTVTHVNTQTCHGKWRRLGTRQGRRSDWKKAIVTLAEGQKIDVKT